MTDSYGDRFTVAEVGGDHALSEMQAFTEPGRLNSAYSFAFLYADKLTPSLVAQVARDWPEVAGWPSWAFENHDAPRAISRWADGPHADQLARTKMLLLATLRGSVIIYQGEELGLPQVDVPFDQLQDPEAIANWPHTLSRDGARTPMPWTGSATNLGFSTGTPWLPLGKEHGALAVDQQERPGSMLSFTRQCIALRREQEALQAGSMEIRQADDALLVFDRGGQLRCTFNLSVQPQPFAPSGRELLRTGPVDDSSIGPYGAVIEEIP